MSNKKSDLQKLLCKPKIKYTVAFFVPVVLILIIFNRLDLYPYKSLTLLTSDLNGQYSSYFAYMKDMFRNGNDIFYTFSKTLGGDMYGLSGYYLMSPLNLVFIFMKLEDLPVAILIVSLVKIGLSGLTMYLLLSSRKGCLYRNIMLSTSYAVMGYTISFLMNLMWLDAVYMLPLVVIGLERIYRKKSAILYILTLSFTIITCYYTGYMVCIFIAIYACYLFVINNGKIKQRIKSFMRFCLASLCAGGISAVVLLPSVLSLSGSKDTNTEASFNLTSNFSLTDFISKFFSGSYKEKFYDLPNIYCGIIILVLCILFFFNKNIKIKEKIASFIVLSILFASMYVKQFDMVWHGFATPNSFFFRYSFVLVFFAINMSERCLSKINNACKKIYYYIPPIIVVSLSVVLFCTNRANLEIKLVILDVIIAVVATFLLYRYRKTDKILAPVVMILIMMLQAISLYNNDYSILSKNKYYDNSICGFVNEVKPCIDDIKAEDTEFYRMEKTFYYSINDPMLLSYKGLSHFSSTEKEFVKNFMKRMGYTENYTYWSYYNMGSTTAADSLLGVKYILSRDKLLGIYELKHATQTVNTYYNPYALPLGFVCNSEINNIDNEIENDDQYVTENKFEFQNSVYKAMTGSDKSIFTRIDDYQIYLENVDEYTEFDHYWYTKQNPNDDGYVHFVIEAQNSYPIYMYLEADITDKAQIYVNGKSLGDYFDVYRHDIVCLGEFETGNMVDVAVKVTKESINFEKPYIYYQNMEVLKQQTSLLQNSSMNITKYKSSHIYGEINVDEDNMTLFLSIPYDKNWTIKVDGKVVKQDKVIGALTGVNVNKGKHTIELNYLTPGFNTGLIVSVASVLIFIVYIVFTIVKRKRSNHR